MRNLGGIGIVNRLVGLVMRGLYVSRFCVGIVGVLIGLLIRVG